MTAEQTIELVTLIFGFATTVITLLLGYKVNQQGKDIAEIKSHTEAQKNTRTYKD